MYIVQPHPEECPMGTTMTLLLPHHMSIGFRGLFNLFTPAVHNGLLTTIPDVNTILANEAWRIQIHVG